MGDQTNYKSHVIYLQQLEVVVRHNKMCVLLLLTYAAAARENKLHSHTKHIVIETSG